MLRHFKKCQKVAIRAIVCGHLLGCSPARQAAPDRRTAWVAHGHQALQARSGLPGPSVGTHGHGSHQLGAQACMGGAGHRLALLNVLQHVPSVGRMGTGSHQLGAVGLHGPKAGHQPGNQRQQMHDLNRGNKAKRGNKWGNKPKFFANTHREKRIPTSRPLLIFAPVRGGIPPMRKKEKRPPSQARKPGGRVRASRYTQPSTIHSCP